MTKYLEITKNQLKETTRNNKKMQKETCQKLKILITAVNIC